ncbi:MAG: hypothetical protein AAGI38_11475 [Bacteroidota bacterium]
MRKALIVLIFLSVGRICHAQQDTLSALNKFGSRIFLPSIDVGYQFPTSELLESSLIVKTTIEYRLRNNNDFFIRLSYDTYGARYKLAEFNNTTNTIEGTVQFSDVLLGPGYRFGDNDYRLMVAFMPGIKSYEFPTATLDGQRVIISQESQILFTTSFLTTLEFYFDPKSALTISFFQNQVWEDVDFWEDGRAGYGFTIGFITSLL